ncbi:hypothetical protein DICPUDRAFT_81989 [Dictyostelium purpureum]|uniref:Uncharacterized protein n=1 Tax=Dictyostelium purpureum TaxID=5786 RepID=F0ZV68_DICPU|nr:uncharacterized protein DICPUDRAFT_81989 [Dictyostelium purpureum]EGC32175.1 hypothetical protein DICPUDRAFT_81989 [Dictyostelium purpureum]|eukprot:XP_003291313.1 hypothetical protein DICPUDRAFT_81989 [Dictyostelium purpureum]
MVMMNEEYIALTKPQYFFIVACAFLGTLGVMGWCQNPFDIILGLANMPLMIIGVRGIHKRKKPWLWIFMWAMVALGILYSISLAVVLILYYKHRKDEDFKTSNFGFVPDVVVDAIKALYCLGLAIFTSFIRKTLDQTYKKPSSQMNRI